MNSSRSEKQSPVSRLVALLLAFVVSIVAVTVLVPLSSAFPPLIGQAPLLLCSAIGLWVLRRVWPEAALSTQILFFVASLLITAWYSFMVSWYVLGERL